MDVCEDIAHLRFLAQIGISTERADTASPIAPAHPAITQTLPLNRCHFIFYPIPIQGRCGPIFRKTLSRGPASHYARPT